MLAKVFDQYADYGPLVLRIVLAVVFIAHGYQKLFGMGIDAVGGMFASLGIPLPLVMAWIVALVEFGGGILLLLGFFTRYVSMLLAIIMVVAIVKVKLAIGLIAPMGSSMAGAELDLALLAGAIALTLLGPGAWSGEHMLFKREW